MRGFVLGMLVGAVTAVMVAPKRGAETREMVRARVDLWQDQITNKLDQARAEVETMRHEVLGRLDEMRFQYVRPGEEMKIRTERPGEAGAGPPESASTGI